jgi:hypothetical protein
MGGPARSIGAIVEAGVGGTGVAAGGCVTGASTAVGVLAGAQAASNTISTMPI